MMSDVVIRPFLASDEPRLEALALAACGSDDLLDHAVWGEARDVPPLARTFVALSADEPIGFVTVYQNVFHYHPRDFRVSFAVHPRYRRQGIGRALHNCALEALSQWNGGNGPVRLRTLTRHTSAAVDCFLQELGYRRLLLSYRPTLIVDDGWPKKLGCIPHPLAAGGYTVHTLAELAARGVADATIVELCLEAYADTHTHSPPTGTLEQWRQVFLGDDCIREAFFVVLKDGKPVAFSSVRDGDNPEHMELAWDGVARSERAVEVPLRLALKAREIEFARARRPSAHMGSGFGRLSGHASFGFVAF